MRHLAVLVPFVLLLLGVPSAALGQSPDSADITGVVGDVRTGHPIPGVVVELPELERKAVTNGEGRFVFLGLPPGSHQFRIEALGYASWEETTAVEHMDLLRIGLLPRPIELEAIRVTADRLERRRLAAGVSVWTTDRRELTRATEGSAARLVERYIPYSRIQCRGGGLAGATAADPGDSSTLSGGIGDIDSFCIRARGRLVRPVFYLDDQEVPYAELWSYLPAELYVVEYYGGGREVRLYTTRFVESGGRLKPRGGWR